MVNLTTWEIIWSYSDINRSWDTAWTLELPFYFRVLHKFGHLVTEKSSHSLAETFSKLALPISSWSLHEWPLPAPPYSPLPVLIPFLSPERYLDSVYSRPIQTGMSQCQTTSRFQLAQRWVFTDYVRLHDLIWAHSRSPAGKDNEYLMNHMQSTALSRHTFSFIESAQEPTKQVFRFPLLQMRKLRLRDVTLMTCPMATNGQVGMHSWVIRLQSPQMSPWAVNSRQMVSDLSTLLLRSLAQS